MPSRWQVLPADPVRQTALQHALDLHPLVAQLLVNRGVTTVEAAQQYLGAASTLDALHDPLLLRDMPQTVQRIRAAIAKQEHILVFGDYDVDGVTATAVTTSTLRALGATVSSLLPNRLDDGYGPSEKLIRTARERGVGLVITLDCGTTAAEHITTLAQLGIETIIVDHHTPRMDAMPPAHTMINPWHPDCAYPHKGLASVGLAFKLAQALFQGEPHRWEEQLDLVALGTIADVVPLMDENRVLVTHGLRRLAARRRLGVKSLMDVAGIGDGPMRPFHVGFVLGPRLNASGRLGSADRALQLLLTDSQDEAATLARALQDENRERQRIESQVVTAAVREVEDTVDFSEARVLVVGREGWHTGVVGIVAARLVDRFYRPSIVIGFNGDTGRGSGRSIRGFNLTAAITECGALLESFGGHPMACGLTIRQDQLGAFREAVNRVALTTLPISACVRERRIDADVPLSIWDEPLLRALSKLEPHGAGNPEPQFVSRRLAVSGMPRRVGKNHLKCLLASAEKTCEAIGFGMAARMHELGEGTRIDCVYTPSLNTWDGLTSVQLSLKDFRIVA